MLFLIFSLSLSSSMSRLNLEWLECAASGEQRWARAHRDRALKTRCVR